MSCLGKRVGGPHPRLNRLQARAARERLGYQRVELRVAERRPPIGARPVAHHKDVIVDSLLPEGKCLCGHHALIAMECPSSSRSRRSLPRSTTARETLLHAALQLAPEDDRIGLIRWNPGFVRPVSRPSDQGFSEAFIKPTRDLSRRLRARQIGCGKNPKCILRPLWASAYHTFL